MTPGWRQSDCFCLGSPHIAAADGPGAQSPHHGGFDAGLADRAGYSISCVQCFRVSKCLQDRRLRSAHSMMSELNRATFRKVALAQIGSTFSLARRPRQMVMRARVSSPGFSGRNKAGNERGESATDPSLQDQMGQELPRHTPPSSAIDDGNTEVRMEDRNSSTQPCGSSPNPRPTGDSRVCGRRSENFPDRHHFHQHVALLRGFFRKQRRMEPAWLVPPRRSASLRGEMIDVGVIACPAPPPVSANDLHIRRSGRD